jgi:hypothetical protein
VRDVTETLHQLQAHHGAGGNSGNSGNSAASSGATNAAPVSASPPNDGACFVDSISLLFFFFFAFSTL